MSGTDGALQVRERQDFLAAIAAARRTPAAFEPIYRMFAREIFAFCVQQLGDHDAAADMTSRIFLKAMNGMRTYEPSPSDPVGAYRGWLYRIARNEAIDQIRRLRPVQTLADDESVADSAPLPEEAHLREERAAELRRFIERLPLRQRQILQLRLLDLSGQEIGEILGMSTSAIKSAQFRAYESLRQWYAQREGSGEGA